MELRQLEYFLTVAEEASFTRAAARLHVAQPGISAQVRRLERELGQPLLDRSARTVRLTEAGETVLPYARAALAAVEGARFAVQELTGLLRGHVTMGTVGSISTHEIDLPDLLAGFHRVHPGVDITLSEETSDRLVDGLRTGRLDVALAGLPAPPPGIETQVCSDQALVAAVAPSHELAGHATVPLVALAGRALITLPYGTGLRTAVEDACAAAGFRPRIAFEAGDPRVLARLAARGLGVAILPEAVVAGRTDLRAVALTRPSLRGRLVLAWRAEGPPGPAASAFIAHARATLPRAGSGSPAGPGTPDGADAPDGA